MRDLQFLAENDTKDAQISRNSHKKCIVRLQEILKKKSVQPISQKIYESDKWCPSHIISFHFISLQLRGILDNRPFIVPGMQVHDSKLTIVRIRYYYSALS